jgi:hypothetical protein
MEQTRERALAAFEIVLGRLDATSREPGAWTEHNPLHSLVAITSEEYDRAVARIAAAQRPPTLASFSAIERRGLLTKAEIRDQFEAAIRPIVAPNRHSPAGNPGGAPKRKFGVLR